MCLLIVEILMLIAGLWALITGKLPETLFKVLFGKGKYYIDSKNARLLGILLALPIPLVFISGLVLSMFFGGDSVLYAALLEIVIVIVVSIISMVIARRIKNNSSEQML